MATKQEIFTGIQQAVKLAEDAIANNDNKTRDQALELATQLKAQLQATPDAPGTIYDSGTPEGRGEVSQQRPEIPSTITGMTPGQAAARGQAGGLALAQGFTEALTDTARYAPAVAAGLVGGPEAAPVGIEVSTAIRSGLASPLNFTGHRTIGAAIREMVAASSKTAITQAAGSTVAQLAEIQAGERKMFDERQIAQEVLTSNNPQIRAGGLMTRSFLNSALAVGSSEASRAMDKEGYSLPVGSRDYLLRIGVPSLLSTAASAGGNFAERSETASRLASQATSDRWGSSVLLSEVLPSATNLEAQALQLGNKTANTALSKVGANIGSVIDTAFPNIPSTSEASAMINQAKGQLTQLQQEANAAQQTADTAQAEFQRQKLANGPRVREAYQEAQRTAFEASKQRIIANEGLRSMLGSSAAVNGIQDTVANGKRMEDLTSVASAAKNSMKSQIDALYLASGVTINDPVITQNSALSAISNRKFRRAGGKLEDNELYNKALKLVKDRFNAASPTSTPLPNSSSNTMTLGQFRRLRDDVADELVKGGAERTAASRFASGLYESLQGASDNTVKAMLSKRNPLLGPSQFQAYKLASSAAASDFATRSSGAMDAIASGDINSLFKAIKEQGAGPFLREIDAHAASIARSGNPKIAASVTSAQSSAALFKKGVMSSIGDSVLDDALLRGTGQEGSRIIQPAKLAQTLDILDGKGFPVDQLGFGTRDTRKALARIASSGTPGGWTLDETQQFFNDAQTLGANKAAERVKYLNDVQNNLLDAKVGGRNTIYQTAQQGKTARAAGVTAKEAQDAYDKASQNPLVQLMDRVNQGEAPSIPLANGNELVSQLLRANPNTVSGLMKALPVNTAEDVRRATAATIFRQFLPFSEGAKSNVADTKKLINFFEGQGADDIMQRESFKRILGDSAYNNLFKNLYQAVKSTTKAIANVGEQVYLETGTTPLAAGRAKYKVQDNLAVYMNPMNALDMIKNGRYNLLYAMYANPISAPVFKSVSGNLTKFANLNAVNQHIVRIANEADMISGQSGTNMDPNKVTVDQSQPVTQNQMKQVVGGLRGSPRNLQTLKATAVPRY